MYEQDYIMRLIKESVRTMLKLLFDIDAESPSAELLEESGQKETLYKLMDAAEDGKIREAEQELLRLAQENKSGLKLALLFYAYLNDKDDDFLQQHGFTREEIKAGIQTAVAPYGLGDMTELFFTDL